MKLLEVKPFKNWKDQSDYYHAAGAHYHADFAQ